MNTSKHKPQAETSQELRMLSLVCAYNPFNKEDSRQIGIGIALKGYSLNVFVGQVMSPHHSDQMSTM